MAALATTILNDDNGNGNGRGDSTAIAIAIVVIIITIDHRRHRHRTSIAEHFSVEGEAGREWAGRQAEGREMDGEREEEGARDGREVGQRDVDLADGWSSGRGEGRDEDGIHLHMAVPRARSIDKNNSKYC